jgi:hypothetical protein
MLPPAIPLLTLSALATYEAQPAGVLLLEPAATTLPAPCFQLFRSTYHTIGLCLQGQAELQVNLDTYWVQAGALLVLPAHCLKQWRTQSADFASRDVLFTADFLPRLLGAPRAVRVLQQPSHARAAATVGAVWAIASGPGAITPELR